MSQFFILKLCVGSFQFNIPFKIFYPINFSIKSSRITYEYNFLCSMIGGYSTSQTLKDLGQKNRMGHFHTGQNSSRLWKKKNLFQFNSLGLTSMLDGTPFRVF